MKKIMLSLMLLLVLSIVAAQTIDQAQDLAELIEQERAYLPQIENANSDALDKLELELEEKGIDSDLLESAIGFRRGELPGWWDSLDTPQQGLAISGVGALIFILFAIFIFRSLRKDHLQREEEKHYGEKLEIAKEYDSNIDELLHQEGSAQARFERFKTAFSKIESYNIQAWFEMDERRFSEHVSKFGNEIREKSGESGIVALIGAIRKRWPIHDEQKSLENVLRSILVDPKYKLQAIDRLLKRLSEILIKQRSELSRESWVDAHLLSAAGVDIPKNQVKDGRIRIKDAHDLLVLAKFNNLKSNLSTKGEIIKRLATEHIVNDPKPITQRKLLDLYVNAVRQNKSLSENQEKEILDIALEFVSQVTAEIELWKQLSQINNQIHLELAHLPKRTTEPEITPDVEEVEVSKTGNLIVNIKGHDKFDFEVDVFANNKSFEGVIGKNEPQLRQTGLLPGEFRLNVQTPHEIIFHVAFTIEEGKTTTVEIDLESLYQEKVANGDFDAQIMPSGDLRILLKGHDKFDFEVELTAQDNSIDELIGRNRAKIEKHSLNPGEYILNVISNKRILHHEAVHIEDGELTVVHIDLEDIYADGGLNKNNLTDEQIIAIRNRYFIYADSQSLDSTLKKRAKNESLSRSQRNYVLSYVKLIEEISESEINSVVEKLKHKLFNLISKLGIHQTPYAESNTWALWDICKQKFFYDHKDLADEDYPQNNHYLSSQKLTEILDRHLGFEYHMNFLDQPDDATSFVNKFTFDKKISKNIVKLLNKTSSSKQLRSLEYAQLGKLLREGLNSSGIEESFEDAQVKNSPATYFKANKAEIEKLMLEVSSDENINKLLELIGMSGKTIDEAIKTISKEKEGKSLKKELKQFKKWSKDKSSRVALSFYNWNSLFKPHTLRLKKGFGETISIDPNDAQKLASLKLKPGTYKVEIRYYVGQGTKGSKPISITIPSREFIQFSLQLNQNGDLIKSRGA